MMDVCKMVTDKIIALIEQEGTLPWWSKPWCSVTGGPYNFVTKRSYSLLNKLMLSKNTAYASYKQYQRIGAQVRKGAKAETVVFWDWPQKQETHDEREESEETNVKKYAGPILKFYHVFPIEDTDIKDLPVPEGLPEEQISPIAKAELLINDYVAREGIDIISEWSDRAYFAPERTVHLPKMAQFESVPEYYSTVFHELSHAAYYQIFGAGKDDFKFASEAYSKNELIAEISSASILHQLNIATPQSNLNNASYVQAWLQRLKDDKWLIVSAIGKVEKIVRRICDSEMQTHTATNVAGA